MRLIRVFPRKTKATPDDALAYFGSPDLFAEADEVHISVTFTYDKAIAEQLAEDWRWVAPVKIGGVAYGDSSLEFIPGRYVKPGYTITSRGCPRRCWFCGVWKKWPIANVLPIYDGWNILDDNLLACPRDHVEAGMDKAAVLAFLADRRIAIPRRTDCMACFFQRLIEWWELWRYNPAAYGEAEGWEAQTGHTFRSPQRDTQPTSLADLRTKFETGWIPRETRDPINAMQCRVCRL